VQVHYQLIQLIVAYALVGAFIFTTIVTCASLIGWIKFKSPSQQKTLFRALIIQICVAGAGFFANVLKFDPAKVQQAILSDEMSAPASQATRSDFRNSSFVGSNFDRSNFVGSTFKEANFAGAIFEDSLLNGSDFAGVNFQKSVFKGADFSGVDLSEIKSDSNTKFPKRN
jgi:uncharacterized protein YjbI with pentapeptide repeats